MGMCASPLLLFSSTLLFTSLLHFNSPPGCPLQVLDHPYEGAAIAERAYALFRELATPERVCRAVRDALIAALPD